jgi:DNA invertase Pin-like site-specific DNA recombinase
MPEKKKRAIGYIRESKLMALDTPTMESQAKLVREYCERMGYDYDPATDEFRESQSAYEAPYFERAVLMHCLEISKDYDVFVCSEVRTLSRRGQGEVFHLYDLLEKNGCSFETVLERFEKSPIGKMVLSIHAGFAETEREQTYLRMERGKKYRRDTGNVNGHPKPAYGLIFVDTQQETNAHYALNPKVVKVTEDGVEWTEHKVVAWMFDRYNEGWSLNTIAFTLTRMGIPIPRTGKIKGKEVSGMWSPTTVRRILSNPIYTGFPSSQRYAWVTRDEEELKRGKDIGRQLQKHKIVKRPAEEHVHLGQIAPAVVSQEVFDSVQERFLINKEESRRNSNTSKEEMGYFRAGYARCGICNGSMAVRPNAHGRQRSPEYYCTRKYADNVGHNTAISKQILDSAGLAYIREVLAKPDLVRQWVSALREENKRKVDPEALEASLLDIRRQMQNLYQLARNATEQETIDGLSVLVGDLEKQKRSIKRSLDELANDEEKRQTIESEITRFEKWAEDVAPDLSSDEFFPSYDEVRFAVRIMGLRAVVFPAHGDYPFRHRFFFAPPKIMRHLVENYDAMNWSIVCEAPESAEPSRKMAVPTSKNHFRPN